MTYSAHVTGSKRLRGQTRVTGKDDRVNAEQAAAEKFAALALTKRGKLSFTILSERGEGFDIRFSLWFVEGGKVTRR